MSDNRQTRILIVDDHQLLADACKGLLEPEFLVVGNVTDGRHVMAAVAELRPNIVLLDIYMPRLNGFDAASQIRKSNPEIKLVFMTMTLAAEVAAEAFRRGASGYVLKQSAATELLLAVRKVNRGSLIFRPSLRKRQWDFSLIRTTRMWKKRDLLNGKVKFSSYSPRACR
jgi:DNA-binding NarL/FixJ family response regulator